MKAVVMEIHKDYCIAMTGDGRFIRQAITAGELEIGDEIIIEEAVFEVPGRDWIKTFAIAAAALLVIGFGSYGLFRVFGGYGTGGETAMVADAREATEEKANDEAMVAVEEAEAETTGEEAEMAPATEESEDFAVEITQVEGVMAGPGKADVEFDLEIASIGEPVEIVAGNLLFMYFVTVGDEAMELILIIEILEPDISFTGKIDAAIVFDDGESAGGSLLTFNNFSQGDKSQNFISFEQGANILHIKIDGVFE